MRSSDGVWVNSTNTAVRVSSAATGGRVRAIGSITKLSIGAQAHRTTAAAVAMTALVAS